MKTRDMDKTITGLLFHPHFLYGLLQFLCALLCAGVAVYLFFINKDENSLVMRIVIGIFFLFISGDPFIKCKKEMSYAYRDWKAYREES